MATTFNQSTAPDELVKHALENSSETGITEDNKEKLALALKEKKENGELKIKIETQAELGRLKSLINTRLAAEKLDRDVDETINGLSDLEIKDVAKEIITESEKPAPETAESSEATEVIENPLAELPSLYPITANIPEKAQEVMAEHKTKWWGIWEILADKFYDFLLSRGLGEYVAKVRWFSNSNSERRAESGYNSLIDGEGRSSWENSPLTNILILDHIDKNTFKKILAQFPWLDLSNKRNREAAFQWKYATDSSLNKYHRIFEGLRQMSEEFSAPESIDYNPEERLKRLLSYSRNESMDESILSQTPPVIDRFIPEELGESENFEDLWSAEVQVQDLIEARNLDSDLKKTQDKLVASKAVTPVTDESNKQVVETETKLKPLQEKLDVLKESEKWIMLEALWSTGKVLETLMAQKTVLDAREPKDTKEIATNKTQIDFYEKNKLSILSKIESVMARDTANTDKWNFLESKSASDIVTARFGIQSIMKSVPITENEVALENQEPETVLLSKEVAAITQEIEQRAQEYSQATTPDGKTAIKESAQNKYESLQAKNITAEALNTIIQWEYGKLPEKAKKSEEAMKHIKISTEKAQKAIQKIESEGTINLKPLDPSDQNNLLYFEWKLYQRESKWLWGGNTYQEMFFDGNNLKRWSGGKFIDYTSNTELSKKGHKVISYKEANDRIWTLLPSKRKVNKDDWIYVKPEYFAGKLRNIKID